MELITYNVCPCCGSPEIVPKLSVKDYVVSGQEFEIWECNECSARFTQHVPGEQWISGYYQSEGYISHTDTKKGFINSLYHIIRKRTLGEKKKLMEHAIGAHEGTLLDIGAGTGAFCRYMKNAGWKVVGLEPDDATRQRAYEIYGLLLYTTSELFVLRSGSYDAITMWHVLEHVHELHKYVEQVKNLLKAEGKAFIAVPNYNSYDASKYQEFWAAYDVPRHLYHFSPRSMRLLLEKHGMRVIDIKPMWYDSFYVSLLSEQYKAGKSNHLEAFTTGIRSNIKAIMNKEKCSSLIYIIEKI